MKLALAPLFILLKATMATVVRPSSLGLNFVGIGDGLVTDLVQGIRGVGDQLSQENLLVGVEGIDDQACSFKAGERQRDCQQSQTEV